MAPVRNGDAGAAVSAETAKDPAQGLMMEALAGMRAGRAAEMAPLWRRSLIEYPKLRDYQLYYLGLAEASAGRLDEARQELETLLREERDSVLRPYAEIRLASLLARTETRTAIRHLREARTDLPERSAEWAKASLLLARLELQAGRTGTAWQLLADVRRRVGPGVARRRARREVRRLAAVSPETARRPPRVAEEARLLLLEDVPGEARRLLVTALEAKPSRRFRPGLLRLLATAQYEEGLAGAAEDTVQLLLDEYSSHGLAARALLESARRRWNRDDDEVALERFERFARQYPRHRDVPEALHAIGRIHQAAGRFAAARSAYSDLARRFPRAGLVGDAQWRQGWLEYIQRHHAAAGAAFGRLAATTPHPFVRARSLYWQARAVELDQGVAAAWPLVTGVIGDAPYGYYAVWAEEWIATHALKQKGAGVALGLDPNDTAQSPDTVLRLGGTVADLRSAPRSLALLAGEPAASVLDPERFGRAVDLAKMGLNRHAERELDAVRFPPASEGEARLILLEAYERVGAYHRTLRLSGSAGPSVTRTLEPMDRFRYPLGYWRLIRECATEYGLDPYLVAAVIRQESAFDPRAVSPKGARGLMQLMPETAAEIAVHLGLPPPPLSDLERPTVNLRLGTAYLARLLDSYGGRIHRALAAYNAGEEAVGKWERRFPDVAPDEFVEQISYRETQAYVKLVMRNHRVYRLLYGERDAAPGLAGRGWSESPDSADSGIRLPQSVLFLKEPASMPKEVERQGNRTKL